MALRRRPLALVALSCLGAFALSVPACRFGYEELDRSDRMLAGGEGSTEAGTGSGNAPGLGGAPVDGGAPGSGGSVMGGASMTGGSVNGGSQNAGNANGGSMNGGTTGASGDTGFAGVPGADGGAGPVAPPCTSTADCTCDTLDGHSYWFCQTPMYWSDANAHCQTNGMTLVRVDRATENDFLLSAGTTHGVFTLNNFAQIGASDQAVGGEWRWADGALFWQGGSGGKLVSGFYANWDGQSPSASGAQQCSGLLASGLWQDRSCTAEEPFICESP